MKDNDIARQLLRDIDSLVSVNANWIYIESHILKALEAQREEIKGMIEDMRNRNAYLGNDKYFAGILQGQDQIIYDIINNI